MTTEENTTSDTMARSKVTRMNWNKWVRQIHRWLSIAFTVVVIVNFVAFALGEPPAWLYFLPLLPLALLLLSGLYLFVLPYAAKWRSERRTSA